MPRGRKTKDTEPEKPAPVETPKQPETIADSAPKEVDTPRSANNGEETEPWRGR